MILNMDQDINIYLMDHVIKDSSKKESDMVEVSMSGIMAKSMMVSGIKAEKQEAACGQATKVKPT